MNELVEHVEQLAPTVLAEFIRATIVNVCLAVGIALALTCAGFSLARKAIRLAAANTNKVHCGQTDADAWHVAAMGCFVVAAGAFLVAALFAIRLITPHYSCLRSLTAP